MVTVNPFKTDKQSCFTIMWINNETGEIPKQNKLTQAICHKVGSNPYKTVESKLILSMM